MDLPEHDWKHLRTIKDAALNRYCERVLLESADVVGDTALTPHQRYLKLFKLMQDRDRELADTFDGLRRSTALLQLMSMRHLGLVTDGEMAGFSPETRDRVESWLTRD